MLHSSSHTFSFCCKSKESVWPTLRQVRNRRGVKVSRVPFFLDATLAAVVCTCAASSERAEIPPVKEMLSFQLESVHISIQRRAMSLHASASIGARWPTQPAALRRRVRTLSSTSLLSVSPCSLACTVQHTKKCRFFSRAVFTVLSASEYFKWRGELEVLCCTCLAI